MVVNPSVSTTLVLATFVQLPPVRMYGFKLEGEWFKEGFRKKISLKWNSFKKTWLRTQFAKNTKQFSTAPEKQSVVSQKQSVVYTS